MSRSTTDKHLILLALFFFPIQEDGLIVPVVYKCPIMLFRLAVPSPYQCQQRILMLNNTKWGASIILLRENARIRQRAKVSNLKKHGIQDHQADRYWDERKKNKKKCWKRHLKGSDTMYCLPRYSNQNCFVSQYGLLALWEAIGTEKESASTQRHRWAKKRPSNCSETLLLEVSGKLVGLLVPTNASSEKYNFKI